MKKVLAVGMLDSVHFARWVSQFDASEVKFILFPSTPHRKLNPILKSYIRDARNRGLSTRVPKFASFFSIPLWLLDQLFSNKLRAFLIRRELMRESFDYVHAMEFQNAGYLATAALSRLENRPKFIATNWGSDIFWFKNFSSHLGKIREVLEVADFYSCECVRDVQLARELGYKKVVLPVFPNAGGFADEDLVGVGAKPRERKIILVKGYEGWAGQAKLALEALGTLDKIWTDFKVVVFSANLSTALMAKRLARQKNVEITVHRKKTLSHGEMLDLFAKSRIYLGVSRTDGISTSMLEAMASGSYPIQTSTSCAGEWQSAEIKNLLLIQGTKESIAAAVEFAVELQDDSFQQENIKIIRHRAMQSHIHLLARRFYNLDGNQSQA